MEHLKEINIFYLLLQLAIILSLATYFGQLLKNRKQPTITADIIIGVILGPSIFGRFFPEFHSLVFPKNEIQVTMLDTVGWLGLLLLLLSTGLEINFSSIWKQKANALKISVSDIVIPIVFSFSFIYFLPNKFFEGSDNKVILSFFISVIMTISALPVSIRALKDMGILKSDLGFLTISALTINDIIGWIIFTLILSIFSLGRVNLGEAFSILMLTLAFTAFALSIGKRIINYLLEKNLKKDKESVSIPLTIVIVSGLFFGLITLKIGIHSLFGFFMAGIAAGESKFLSEKARNTIHDFIYSMFASVFFVNIGLKIDFFTNFNVFLVLFITIIGIGGRYLGAYVGGSFSKLDKDSKKILAIAHTPGGEMHIVVSLLALELGLLNQTMFVSIVAGAIFSSILTGPWLSYVIKNIKTTQKIKIYVFDSIESSNKYEFIKLLLNKSGNYQDENYKKIIQRESEFSTGLIKGFAVPHGRIDNIESPIIIFGRSPKGIDWDLRDGSLANNVFLILNNTEKNNIQLEILKKIALILKEQDKLSEFNKIEKSKDLEIYLNNIFNT